MAAERLRDRRPRERTPAVRLDNQGDEYGTERES